MKIFSSIGIAFLKEYGDYRPDYCQTEQEAREKILTLDKNTSAYPVYFFPTNTSGEKKFEEFYVEGEDVDMKTFK